MKTLTRILIGLTSSLLATAGLFRAAEKLDPLTHALRGVVIVSSAADRPAEGCADPCNYLPRESKSTIA